MESTGTPRRRKSRRGRRPGALFLVFCLAALSLGAISRVRAQADDVSDAGNGGAVSSEVQMLRALERASESSFLVRVLLSAFVLVVLPLGVVIDIVFLWRVTVRRERMPRRRVSVGWGLWDVLKVIVVFLLAISAFHAAYPIIRSFSGGASEVSLSVLFQFLAEIIALSFVFMLIPSGGGGALRELGLGRGSIWRDVLTGLKAYIGFLPVMFILVWVTEAVAARLGVELKPQEEIGFFFMDLSVPGLLFLASFVAVLGPVAEEVFFRGFAYQALRNRWSRWPSIIVTALLFSALHTSFSVFLPILGLGVLLASVFERSGSLVPSITIHVCQNGIAVAAALLIRIYS